MTDEDTVDIRYLKIFLVGPPGVGKTTTLGRLLKRIKNIHSAGDQYQSTLLANCIQVLALVPAEGCETEWLSSTDVHDEAKLTFGYVCCRKPSRVSPDVKRSKHLISAKDIAVIPSKATEMHNVQHSETMKESPKKHDPLQPSESEAIPDYQNRLSHIKAKFQSIIKRGDYSTIARHIGDTLLNINDIGGQPAFLEMLPALSTGPAMYLVFFNLSKRFDEPYNIPFSRDDKIITPYKSVHTVKSTICQILSSIASIHSISHDSESIPILKATAFGEKFNEFLKIHPVAALIGTHRDKLGKVDDDIEHKLRHVDDNLIKLKQAFKKFVTSRSTLDTSFFSVDNYNGTERSGSNSGIANSDDITIIREYMNKIFLTHFKEASLPLRPKWLILSSMLRTQFKIVKMEDCLELGKMLEMDEKEINFCFWYLHCIGIIMYFDNINEDKDDWFKNHVICTPEVIFESISQLPIASLCALHSESHVIDHDRDELIRKGQFSIESIKRYSSDQIAKKIKEEELIPAEQLIKLLKHVNLLSPITNTEIDGSKRITYFMPAVLDCASPDELTVLPSVDDNNPEPLLITFSCGYVPTGTFCGLITRLVSLGPDGILGLTWELVEDSVKRNFVSFHIDYANKVTLLCHDKCYELRVERSNPGITLHDLCTHVLSVILYILQNLYKKLISQIAFRCPCPRHSECRRTDNLCTLIEIRASTNFFCGRCPVPALHNSLRVWMGKVRLYI